MCKRECVYNGSLIAKGMGHSCGYSSAMEQTSRKLKTRTGQLWEKVKEKHPDWSQEKKQKWVMKQLDSERCPFFESNGRKGKPEKKKNTGPRKPAGEKPKRVTYRGKMDQERARELYNQGLNDVQIADALGNVTDGAVFSWRQKLELPANSRKGGNHRKIDRAEFRRLYDQGLTDTEMAGRLGCSEVLVQKWRYENRLPKHGGKRPGRKKAQAERYLEEKHRQEGEGT